MTDQMNYILHQIAQSNNMEFHIDSVGDICIRPMHFNDERIRELRYSPDPCEFKKLEAAIASLIALNQRRLALFGKLVETLADITAGMNDSFDSYSFVSYRKVREARILLVKARALESHNYF